MAQLHSAQYALYHNPFSICSLMVRFTLALRKQPKSLESGMDVQEVYVDIYKDEQLEEKYLKVNPKGQVPALTSASLREPLTDSLDITHHVISLYPHLAPAIHRDTVIQLLHDLHQIQYLSLSFTPQQNRAGGVTVAIDKLLEQPVPDSYRKALEFKAKYHEVTLVHALEPEPIAKAERQAREFFQKIQKVRVEDSLWLFGDDVGPTALDAHTVVFIARLLDANRSDLIDQDSLEYGRKQLETSKWKSFMDGKPTLKSLWVAAQKK